MFWDVHREVKAIRRRMACRMRITVFLAASMGHLVAALLMLLWQTSCVYPRCVDGSAFDGIRALIGVPLFVTPWISLPSAELDFNEGWTLFGLLAANAVMAVAFWWTAYVGARHAYAWCARCLSRYRASSACSAARGR